MSISLFLFRTPDLYSCTHSYVSCSECSYDSEACTCTSADRCYCSLGADHDVAAKLEATKKQQRHSLYSCGTEDKCYCSMTEATQSQTTCCESDSCISTSKCYCHRGGRKAHSHHTSHRSSHSDTNNNYANSEHDSGHPGHQKKSCKKDKDKKKSKEGKSRRSDNLGLDYELFTVSGSKTTKSSGTTGKSVKAHEALSVKKSVEAAAIFADVKLSQTTDISNLVSSGGESTQKRTSNGKKMNNLNGEDKRGNRESTYGITKSDMGSVMTREKSLMKIRVGGGKPESIYGSTNGRPVSASGLEDSLGYLP